MIEFDQYKKDLEGVRKSVVQSGEALHIDHMREQIDELNEEMNQPEFWNDLEHSYHVNQKLGRLKAKLAHYEKLLATADDIEVMMDLAQEEDDEDMAAEVGTELAALKERIAKAEAARSQEQPAEEAPEAPVESETAAETETEETK